MNIFIKISEKIERVRLEPEHVRLRWVWGAVAISMFFILAIWLFSVGSLFQGEKTISNEKKSDTTSVTDQLRTLKQKTPSIKDFTDQSLNTDGEGITNISNTQ